MSNSHQLSHLKNRLVEAAVDFPISDLDYVFFTGSQNAFPFDPARKETRSIQWPWQSTAATATVIRYIEFPDRFDLHAFFGRESATKRFSRLAESAIRLSDSYKTPVNYENEQERNPHLAWLRWLVDHAAERVERRCVSWEQNRPEALIWSQDEDRKQRGCCLAHRFSNSIFGISASLITGLHDGSALASGPTADEIPPALEVTIDPPKVIFKGESYVDLGEQQVIYLAALAEKAEKGDGWISGAEIQRANELFDAKHVTRTRNLLPKPLRDLIQSTTGRGSRLRKDKLV